MILCRNEAGCKIHCKERRCTAVGVVAPRYRWTWAAKSQEDTASAKGAIEVWGLGVMRGRLDLPPSTLIHS